VKRKKGKVAGEKSSGPAGIREGKNMTRNSVSSNLQDRKKRKKGGTHTKEQKNSTLSLRAGRNLLAHLTTQENAAEKG